MITAGRAYTGGELVKRGAIAAGAVLLMLFPLGAVQGSGPSEYEVKAAFLYNFALHVEWPASTLQDRPSFTIGAPGKDLFGGALEKIVKDRLVQGKPVEVRHFGTSDEVKACHVMFLPHAEREQLEKIAKALKGSSTLLGGEPERLGRDAADRRGRGGAGAAGLGVGARGGEFQGLGDREGRR